MSLVERALKKLQESAHMKPAPVPPAAAAPAPETPATSAGRPSAAPRQPRVDAPSRIVTLDQDALRGMQLLPPLHLERRFTSQYQQIKRSLVATAFGQGGTAIPSGQLIMLASALPGEGKTFISINLALSLAREQDLEVLLIDADVAKPHVSRLFGIEQERGLLDLLTDSGAHPDSVILSTNVPGLKLMSAGRQIDTATELLASQRMHDVVQQLMNSELRRIILFDSPPLLLSTESRALVPNVGHVVIVVRAESTPHSAVTAAIEAVGEGKPTSLILNQSSAAAGEGYYGYGPYGDAMQEATAS